jgi:membrane associated rhomboid family serine protease/antitoxin component HigA of HigAB toxin-antitoxin module
MLPVGTNLSLKRIPWTTLGILFLNWIIFGATYGDYPYVRFWMSRYLFFVPGEQHPWQVITSMFFHADMVHIVGNSLYLWIFGAFVEDKLGWRVYLFLYLLTGVAADLVHGTITALFMREELFFAGLGASGAISGIMGVYLYRCYYSKIKLLIDLWLPMRIQVPAVIILGFWFLQDFVGGINSIRGFGPDIAFWAHVGGFGAGFGACKYLRYEIPARKEKLEFVAETSLQQYAGYGKGIEATEKLLETDQENPELHLNLARAKSRSWATPEAKEHYEKAIKLLLEKAPDRVAEVFIEYWKKYLSILEPRYQVRISLLLNKNFHVDLAAKTLQQLIDSNHHSDIYMEQAYLNLGKIYSQQLGRKDLAVPTYEKFLEKFPNSERKGFVEKMLRSMAEGSGF